ncbi:Retrovirus-related Pol polyprotein from transposon RE2 [Fusarium oxysporum f. sp. albedinis]|nr:Retrovirus-related Pol polyprotein from transposon RE2 [Fusarium oxysporum f. sp. albedinis]
MSKSNRHGTVTMSKGGHSETLGVHEHFAAAPIPPGAGKFTQLRVQCKYCSKTMNSVPSERSLSAANYLHCKLRNRLSPLRTDQVTFIYMNSRVLKSLRRFLTSKTLTRHWLSDHIQQGLSFQSWSANDIRRSWIIADNNPSRGSLPCSTLLQACPDAVKLLAQKLFDDECARLGGVEGGRTRRYDSAAPVSIALQTNWMRRTGWETMFQDTRRDILVALTELPNCRTNQPMPLGIQGEEVIYSLARDERKLASMMVALDRLLDQCGETVRRTDVCLLYQLPPVSGPDTRNHGPCASSTSRREPALRFSRLQPRFLILYNSFRKLSH